MQAQVAKADACSAPTYWSGRNNVTIQVGGIDRLFELYTPWQSRTGPPDYCSGPPLSSNNRGLVINWHGCNAHFPLLDYHTEISKVTEEAASRGYYTITPLGTRSPGGDYGWNADGIPCGGTGVNDFDFFEAILEFSGSELCVDKSRIYSVGFSTGAFLSYGIACRYPDKIVGIGADAGGLALTYLESCRSSPGAVPVQAFHSLNDDVVPYNGTAAWAGQDAMDALWREKNGCDGTEAPLVTYESSTTICQYWNCPLAPVESCALKGVGHCWYGGRSGGFPVCAPNINDVDATKHMFDFWESNLSKKLRNPGVVP